jgi:hypothetical protein
LDVTLNVTPVQSLYSIYSWKALKLNVTKLYASRSGRRTYFWEQRPQSQEVGYFRRHRNTKCNQMEATGPDYGQVKVEAQFKVQVYQEELEYVLLRSVMLTLPALYL